MNELFRAIYYKMLFGKLSLYQMERMARDPKKAKLCADAVRVMNAAGPMVGDFIAKHKTYYDRIGRMYRLYLRGQDFRQEPWFWKGSVHDWRKYMKGVGF